VLVANLLEGMKYRIRATTVVRNGFAGPASVVTRALKDYIAYDFAVGNLMARPATASFSPATSSNHVVNQKSFRRMWQTSCAGRKPRAIRVPRAISGSGLSLYAYGLLGFISCGLLGHWGLATLLLGAAVLNRLAEAWLVGWTGGFEIRKYGAPPGSIRYGTCSACGVVRQLLESALCLAR